MIRLTQGWKHVESETRDGLVKQILSAGTDYDVLKDHKITDDGTLWMIWERSFDRARLTVEYAIFRDAGDGIDYQWVLEHNDAPLSCPKAFLAATDCLSDGWRTRVKAD